MTQDECRGPGSVKNLIQRTAVAYYVALISYDVCVSKWYIFKTHCSNPAIQKGLVPKEAKG